VSFPPTKRIKYALELKSAIAAMNEARRNAQLKRGNEKPVVSNLTQREKMDAAQNRRRGGRETEPSIRFD